MDIGQAKEDAFSTPPHEPSAKCVDTCNDPLECYLEKAMGLGRPWVRRQQCSCRRGYVARRESWTCDGGSPCVDYVGCVVALSLFCGVFAIVVATLGVLTYVHIWGK